MCTWFLRYGRAKADRYWEDDLTKIVDAPYFTEIRNASHFLHFVLKELFGSHPTTRHIAFGGLQQNCTGGRKITLKSDTRIQKYVAEQQGFFDEACICRSSFGEHSTGCVLGQKLEEIACKCDRAFLERRIGDALLRAVKSRKSIENNLKIVGFKINPLLRSMYYDEDAKLMVFSLEPVQHLVLCKLSKNLKNPDNDAFVSLEEDKLLVRLPALAEWMQKEQLVACEDKPAPKPPKKRLAKKNE